MAGGKSGTSVLETPPFFIALMFTFFLVITLSFEKVSKLAFCQLASYISLSPAYNAADSESLRSHASTVSEPDQTLP